MRPARFIGSELIQFEAGEPERSQLDLDALDTPRRMSRPDEACMHRLEQVATRNRAGDTNQGKAIENQDNETCL